MKILDYIPIGHANAATREQLRSLTGYGDRTNRELIEAERKNIVILNMGDAKGYFIPLPEEDYLIRECLVTEKNRLKAIQSNIRVMEAALKKNRRGRKCKGIPGQMTMF